VSRCSWPWGYIEVNLIENNLTEIPDFVICCTRLEGALLGSNKLTFLPPSLCKLKQLRGLNLCDNNLSALPDELSELPLVLLSIRRNNFDHIPPVVYKMEHLQYLDLGGNNIPSAEIEAYRQLHPNVRMYDENGRLEPLKKSAEKH
jgi:Leucine-rich repeat (LRR) protein